MDFMFNIASLCCRVICGSCYNDLLMVSSRVQKNHLLLYGPLPEVLQASIAIPGQTVVRPEQAREFWSRK